MRKVALLVVSLLVVAGCAYRDGSGGNPILRKFSWFSYLDAGDLRQNCQPGAPDRYRLVLNAVYQEQVRAYDLVANPEGATLTSQVTTPGNVAEIGLDDPLSPWRAKKSDLRLRPADLERLEAALAASGVFSAPNLGLELESEGFYWIVAACRRGEWHYNAYVWPNEDYQSLTFPALLQAWDFTDVPPNPPRKVTKFQLYGETSPSPARDQSFRLKLGRGGLVGII